MKFVNATYGKPTLVACSGATTGDIWLDTSEKVAKSQIQQLKDKRINPELITITIGGNDVNFKNVIAACYLKPIAREYEGLTGDCAENVQQARDNIRATLPSFLTHAYSAIHNAFPRSRLIVVGYPGILTTHWSKVKKNCGWLKAEGEDTFNDLLAMGYEVNNYTARTAMAAGYEFVSVQKALRNHEWCSEEANWGVGPPFWVDSKDLMVVPPQWINSRDQYLFQNVGHPTGEGQRRVASLVNNYIQTHPWSPPVTPSPSPTPTKEPTPTPTPTPTRTGPILVPPTPRQWEAVSAGITVTCGIDASHSLYCWGGGNNGETGQPHNITSWTLSVNL